MTLRTNLMLAGALLAGVASQANAAPGSFPLNNVPSQVSTNAFFGGGASLAAPYIRQTGDCWGDKIDLAFRSNPATQALADFNYLGSPAFNCGTQQVAPAGNALSYISTGSGRGILGYFAHSPFYSDPVGQTGDSWLGSGTGPAPAVYATKVNFAASEAGLPQTDPGQGGDIDAYNGTGKDTNGAASGRYVVQSGVVLAIANNTGAAPTAAQTVPGGTLSKGNPFPNPRNTYGRAIQIPLLIAIPAIAFDPIYAKRLNASGIETTYTFSGATKSGLVKLTNAQLCGLFSGQITDLGDPRLATAFKKSAVAGAPALAGIPVELVGRSDGSGTTSIVYRHLEKVCPAQGFNQYNTDANTAGGNAPTTLPSALQGPTYDKTKATNYGADAPTPVLGKFTRADGNDGVAKYLDFAQPAPAGGATITQFRIGYVGNDFVLPYVATQQNSYNLISAALQNAAGAFVAATPAAATTAFGKGAAALLPPQTTSAGVYSANAGGSRADPATHPDVVNVGVNDPANLHTWVSAANIASPLADPTTAGSYPLVGTTNGLFYQCYADATERGNIRGFLTWYYTNKVVTDPSVKGILGANGLAPVTLPYQKAIVQTFLANAPALGLDIAAPGTTECAGVSTGA